MNAVFFAIVALSFLFAALNGTPAEVGKAALDSAKASVELAIGLIGYITLFLGLMKVVEEAEGSPPRKEGIPVWIWALDFDK